MRAFVIEATAIFAEAAVENNVGAIVNMSQISARRDARSNAAQQHWIAERLLDRSPTPVTHVRPTFFAELLISFGRSIATDNVLRLPLADARHAPVATDDQAQVIAATLEVPEPHRGQIYPLFGPVEMNHYEIAQVFSDTLGRPVTYEPIQIEEFAALLRDRGYSPNLIQHLTEVPVDYRNGIFAGTNDLTESIGQAKPTTVEDFINANMKYFTPSWGTAPSAFRHPSPATSPSTTTPWASSPRRSAT